MEEIKEVTPKEVEKLVREDENIVVLDVREDEEIAQGMIENAKHIPLGELPYSIDELDQKKHHVLICRSGNRSMKAATYLKEKGYDVSNMSGGMLAWEGEVVF